MTAGTGTVHVLPEQRTRCVTVGGYSVPSITVHEIEATGQWNVMCGGRVCVLAEDMEEVVRWLPFIANMQAVAAGYSCHGENSIHRPNPHKVQVMCIGSVSKGTPED